MTQPQPLEVRLWRPFLLFLLAATSVLVIGALDIVYFKKVLDFEISPDKAWIFFLFKFFMLGCGGVIWIQTLIYSFFPPLLARIDEKGVTFGVGARYRPYFVKGSLVSSTSLEMISIHSFNLAGQIDFLNAALIRFKTDPSLPLALATPIGVQFGNGTLALSWIHRDQSGRRIVDTVSAYLASGVWNDPNDLRERVGFASVAPSR